MQNKAKSLGIIKAIEADIKIAVIDRQDKPKVQRRSGKNKQIEVVGQHEEERKGCLLGAV